MRVTKLSWMAVGILSWVLTASAAADVLVMKDGGRVRTQGAWKVQGSVVVFTLHNGTLSSVRTREVDLDRSAQATANFREEARRAAQDVEPRRPRPVVREITSEDVPLASPQVLAAEAAAAAGEAPAGENGAAGGAPENRLLEVVEWQQADQPDGSAEIVGKVRNKTENAVGEVAVRVTVYDADGEVLKSGYAFLAAPALGPRRTTSFRMPLEDVYTFDNVRFDLEGMEILIRATGAGEAAPSEEGPPS